MKKLFATILLAFLTAQVFATFTAFPPQTSGTSTLDIQQAQLFAKADWANNTNCTWSNSVTNTTPQNFAADSDCNDPTVFGNYASAPATKIPAITFSYMPAGVYKFVFNGNRINTQGNNGLCLWDFSNGTVDTENDFGLVNLAGSALYHGGFDGTIKINSPITSSTTFQIRASRDGGGTTCQIDNGNSSKDMSISVYYYPSEQKVFQSSCSGLECENQFSVTVNSSGTASQEGLDWINGNAAVTDTSLFTYTLNSGIFNAAPNCTVSTIDSGTNSITHSKVVSTSTSSVVVRTGYSQTATNFTKLAYSHTLKCERGSDAKQFDSRFIPVVDDTDVFVSGESSAGTSLTDGVTPIDFTETEDKTNSWDGSTFTAPSTGKYHFSGGVELTAAANRFVSAYLSTNGGASYTHHKSMAHFNASSTIIKFEGILELNANDKIQIRLNGGSSTTGTNTVYHWIKIRRTKDSLKAFIGNLTPKEFVQTPSANKPVMYSARILTTGTVDKEVSSWINGSCTNANPQVCTLESGKFSSAPSCVVSSTNQNYHCAVYDESTTGFSIDCLDYNGAGSPVDINKTVICHGVQ